MARSYRKPIKVKALENGPGEQPRRASSRAWRRQQELIAREAKILQTAEQQAQVALSAIGSMPEFRGIPGLREMIVNKVGLENYLQQLQKKPVVVSVDRKEDKWIYVVRGIRPPISYWGDVEIWFVRGGSHHVWAPTKQLGG